MEIPTTRRRRQLSLSDEERKYILRRRMMKERKARLEWERTAPLRAARHKKHVEQTLGVTVTEANQHDAYELVDMIDNEIRYMLHESQQLGLFNLRSKYNGPRAKYQQLKDKLGLSHKHFSVFFDGNAATATKRHTPCQFIWTSSLQFNCHTRYQLHDFPISVCGITQLVEYTHNVYRSSEKNTVLFRIPAGQPCHQKSRITMWFLLFQNYFINLWHNSLTQSLHACTHPPSSCNIASKPL